MKGHSPDAFQMETFRAEKDAEMSDDARARFSALQPHKTQPRQNFTIESSIFVRPPTVQEKFNTEHLLPMHFQ
jgi:hypothetical protein